MANLTKKENSIHSFTQEKLTNHFENNDSFIKRFGEMYYFYTRKFTSVVPQEHLEEFNDMLYESVKSQYYNGYYIAREFIEHEETVLPSEWLAQSEAMMKEQIPSILLEAAGPDFHEIIRTTTSQKLVRWSITKFEDIRGLLQEVFMDVTFMGALRAFLDERTPREVIPLSESENPALQGIVAAYDNLLFVDPQKYLMCLLHTTDSETWEIRFWSSLQLPNQKIGEVTVQRISEPHLSSMFQTLPAYQNSTKEEEAKEKVYVTVSILELNHPEEIEDVVNQIVGTIKKRLEVEDKNVALNVALINQFLSN